MVTLPACELVTTLMASSMSSLTSASSTVISYFWFQLQMIRANTDFGSKVMNDLFAKIEEDLMEYIYLHRLSYLLCDSHDWMRSSLLREDIDDLADKVCEQIDIDRLRKHVNKLCKLLKESNQPEQVKVLEYTLRQRLSEWDIYDTDIDTLWVEFE